MMGRGAARGQPPWLIVPAVLSIAALLLAGCGSSKPAYCSSVKNLETSIKDLKNVDVIATGTNGLKSALSKIETDAKAVVGEAEADFPSQTSPVTSSLSSLTSTVKQLSGTQSAATVVKLGQGIEATVSAVQSFLSATSSKCG